LVVAILDGAIHPLDLSVGPGGFDLGEAVLDGKLTADMIEDVLKGGFILFSVGELDAVVRQDGMDGIRQRPGKLALADLAAGRPVAQNNTRPYGCTCPIPSDSIPIRSWPLFQAERILGLMIESHEDKESKP
jgi:hypothetical protein